MNDKFFVYDQEDNNFMTFETEEEAKKRAKELLSEFAGDEVNKDSVDGAIMWGKISEISFFKIIDDKKDFTPEEWENKGYDHEWDYYGNCIFVNVEEEKNDL